MFEIKLNECFDFWSFGRFFAYVDEDGARKGLIGVILDAVKGWKNWSDTVVWLLVVNGYDF